LSECDGVCTNTEFDPANCGACGDACADDEACVEGDCVALAGGFTGETGAAWALVSGGGDGHGLQAWVPAGERYLYAGASRTFQRRDLVAGSWAGLTAPPGDLAYWGSPALSGGALWEIRPPHIYRYAIATNTWSTVRSDIAGGDDAAMTVTDRDGNLWSYISSDQLVRYNPTTNAVSYFAAPVGGDSYETRLGYDEPTHSIYYGGFGNNRLFRYDITAARQTELASHPEGMLNDIFCSDHSGHIYAAGSSSGTTIWQYTIATNTWRRIPDFPVDHGNNGSCGVLADGWLYMETGEGRGVYRIALY
jgi:hypothetical protein